MRSMKKVLAGLLGLALLGSFTACASDAGNAPADTTAAAGGADTTAAESAKLPSEEGEVTLKFSWWGGDSRHEATQKAVDAFMAKNPNIKVEVNFGAWSGWEDAMSTSFYAGTAPDVNQVNWNWIENYSGDGSVFLDMNTV